MKNLLLCISILIYSCNSEKASDETSIKAEDATVAAAPAGVEFADTPGLLLNEEKDERGNVIANGYYLNGKKESSWTTYSATGLVKSVATYSQGKKEGLSLEMNDNNQVAKRSFYHNDVRHGEYKEYIYTSTKETRTYVNGKIEGLVKVYYDTGKLMEEGNYKNGLRDGLSKWYDQEGNVTIEYEYKNGELVKK